MNEKNKPEEKKNELTYGNNFEENEYIVRSNVLIQAKYKTTLFENKVVMIAMTRIRENSSGELVSVIRASELKKYLNLKGENIYNALSILSKQITHHSLFFEDGKQFITFNIVHKAAYKNGVFYLYFDRALKKYIFDLKGDFTKIKKNSLLLMNNNYTYRIYEILSVYRYHLKNKNSYTVQFPLSEFKCMVGVVNTDEDAVQRLLNKSDPDYDQVIKTAKEKMFNRWYDFSVRVLDVAKKELASSFASEFTFEYSPVRAGRGGRVVAINFTLYKNDKYDEKKVDEYSEILNRICRSEEVAEQLSLPGMEYDFVVDLTLIPHIDDLIKEPLTQKDKLMLLGVAENDMSKIEKAYKLAQKQEHIRNLVPWLRKAIMEGWAENEIIPAMKGHSYEEAAASSKIHEEYLNTTEEEKQAILKEHYSRKNDEGQMSLDFGDEYDDIIDNDIIDDDSIDDSVVDTMLDELIGNTSSSISKGTQHLYKEFDLPGEEMIDEAPVVDDVVEEPVNLRQTKRKGKQKGKDQLPFDLSSLTPEQIEQLKEMLKMR